MSETEAILTLGGPAILLLHLLIQKVKRIKFRDLDITFKDDK